MNAEQIVSSASPGKLVSENGTPNSRNVEHPTVLGSLQGLIGLDTASTVPGPVVVRIELDIGHGRKEKIDVRKGDKPAV